MQENPLANVLLLHKPSTAVSIEMPSFRIMNIIQNYPDAKSELFSCTNAPYIRGSKLSTLFDLSRLDQIPLLLLLFLNSPSQV
jgi:hypothetical protein